VVVTVDQWQWISGWVAVDQRQSISGSGSVAVDGVAVDGSG
jgi:hypothetical protein